VSACPVRSLSFSMRLHVIPPATLGATFTNMETVSRRREADLNIIFNRIISTSTEVCACHVLLFSLVHYYVIYKYYVGSEVLTAVVMKSTIFWDITLCSPLSTDVSEEYIASIFRVEKIRSARNQRESSWQAPTCQPTYRRNISPPSSGSKK
jgi:hypothetical protein